MNCARLRQVLDAHLDGELDRATAAEIEGHLAGCPACTSTRAERDALRERIRAEASYYRAPAALRGAVSEMVRSVTQSAPASGRRISLRQASLLAAAAALAGLVFGLWLARLPVDDPMREQVVASHVASLGPTRPLTDVASGDRHVLKPWFAGKTDFAPPVRDLAADGFELLGARLDHVADRQAAAVVYRIRNHYVSLFVWRAADPRPEPVEVATVRGFAVATWADGGVRFAAVSDVDRRDLERFAALATAIR